jgi:hypothetical protein
VFNKVSTQNNHQKNALVGYVKGEINKKKDEFWQK